MKFKISILLFSLITLSANSQNIFYFDYQIDTSRFIELEQINIDAEKDYESYVFHDTPWLALTNSETEKLIADKSQFDIENKSEIRVYIKFNSSFDTLNILGYSSIYYINDKSNIFYMLPLITIEHNLKPSTYMSVTEVLYYALRDFMKSGADHSLIPVEYKLKNEFEILKPFFYSFTEAEWRLYRDPFQMESMIKDLKEVHKFVSNLDSLDLSYNEFPIPEKMKFTLNTQVHLESKVKYSRYLWHFNNMTNMIVTFNYEHIGIEYISDEKTKSYWAFYNDIQGFINRNETYKIACQLYFSSAIRNKFTPLDYD